MSNRGILFIATIGFALATGCASADSGPPQGSGTDDDGSDDSNLTGNVRQAQLNGLRARVQKDFAGAPSLKGYKLVFRVAVLKADASRAFVRAHVMKRDAAGKDSELSDQNLNESVYKQDIIDGIWDGPEAIAGLKKTGTSWSVMKIGPQEAYAMGPTDVAWTDWATTYGLPRAWLGLSN